MLILLASLQFVDEVYAQTSTREVRWAENMLQNINENSDLFEAWQYMGRMEADSISVDKDNKHIQIFLSSDISHIPIRDFWVQSIKHQVKEIVGRRFRDYHVEMFCDNWPIESFIPISAGGSIDSLRLYTPVLRIPLVKRAADNIFDEGLEGKNIALWASHGYYYEAELDRWEWQRARLFGTVEDLYPYSFTRNFLVPMLEDAGADVFLSRERDIQKNEVIVDNDKSTGNSELLIEHGSLKWERVSDIGFELLDTLFCGDNPFQEGSHLRMHTAAEESGSLTYIPDIPEKGEYAIHVSWAHHESALSQVPYTVNHSGGTTQFVLNQQMAYGTWVYVGTFMFEEGKNPARGSVKIEVPNSANGVVTADAVRFGGGMGNVARRPADAYVPRKWSLRDGKREEGNEKSLEDSIEYSYKKSGKARWMEAGRYYLQYAGMPDSLVYSLNNQQNDYNDDYQSRGEWVNYLMGAPNGPTDNPDVQGLNIPIDLAFAFHTDAGVTPNDSIIGTLGIYSTYQNNGFFPNGKSKLASRDLTDIIQSQIVTDLRLNFNEDWTRRAMWDKQYSEAWRPNVPTMLLELLSHQNLADMKYGLDPRFQFAVSRAIYKGMARFIAAREDSEVKIKPLAPDHLSIKQLDGKRVKISWQPVTDPLEPEAVASAYRVFQREEDRGFDNGIFTTDTSVIVELPEYETIYSFKVAALNKGGRSFPGETLSVSIQENTKDLVLIVNGFDRLAPPSFVDEGVTGVAWWDDEGVPWHRQMDFTGRQYDFDKSSPWLDDDSPGHGASYADMEGQIIAGNTFDYAFLHGEAVRDAGYSFVSVSDEVFEQTDFDTDDFFAVNLIYGEERGTQGLLTEKEKVFRIWTPEMQNALKNYADAGGNIFISGAYIATDMVENQDSLAMDFAEKYLHYKWRTNHADNKGEVRITDKASGLFLSSLSFNVNYRSDIYRVEAPDGIEPVGENAFRIFRYSSNNVSAGIAYMGRHKNVILGFPFETITNEDERSRLMEQILSFFKAQ